MDAARRPIKSRSNLLIQKLAALLAAKGFTPNSISIASIGFSVIGSLALVSLPLIPAAILCALCVQLRLLCNVVDGIVAVEHGKKSAVGAIYNELPDRVADTLFILSLGYLLDQVSLGWAAALLAMATAYIRVLGGALGLTQDFRGPMAKQHRMAVLTVSCLLACVEYSKWATHYSLSIALWVITLGSLLTCANRLRAIAQRLNAQSEKGEAV